MAVILANQGVVVQCRVETPEECQRLYASLDLGKARSIADITGLNQSNLVQPILYLIRCYDWSSQNNFGALIFGHVFEGNLTCEHRLPGSRWSSSYHNRFGWSEGEHVSTL